MRVQKPKHTLYIFLAVILCMVVCLVILKTGNTPEPVTMNVSLYKVVPDYDSFKKTIADRWKEKHPEVELNFENWDCYSGEVPEGLDVFVFDTISLDSFAERGFLLALSEKDIQDYNDLIPSFVEGCRVNGTLCVIPQFLCTDLLYTRKKDADLKNVQNIDDLYSVLGDSGLLLEKYSFTSKIGLYLQALIDEKQSYMDQYPPIKEGELSPIATDSLEKMRKMHLTDSEGDLEDESRFYYARKFAEGMGRAYIGYSEAMNEMGESASDMDFRLFSMTGDENIPVFYVDAAAINAKISDKKRALALDLLNIITGTDALTRAIANDSDPQYLLAARYSIYDALKSDYPIYKDLKNVASVPDAFVFRIKPDGNDYLEEAEKNKDAMLPLMK
ncbi:carbohydrate ABC transporter substrate-binding protein, CUT1 family [Sarcina sp. DSM 11001]|uniref:thiamine pyridinylase n=1 Tax=Sarcina sp. DSM 11001 TaxID=1798184 RepID=UPI000882413F|nr:thiamine pyridinylase [Sarcina sp. DSM 11001]SDK93322.1 carbohydrate ABC transporter substrate-binding protein, CUT1 family [Sarcina sp. DSM 11001]